MISAEDITGHLDGATERFAEFLLRRTSDVDVIAYVRPPCSFMSSAFQQRVKEGSQGALQPASMWPAYERRLGKLDASFGRERVKLKPFIRDTLKEANVVSDFAAELGLQLDPTSIVTSNEGISLEAISLLYCQRRFGSGLAQGFRKALSANRRFVDLVAGIGSRPFFFSRAFIEPIVIANRADLDWIETRIGCAILDLPEAGAGGVSSEEDFLRIAAEHEGFLDRMIMERFQTNVGSPGDRTVGKLDLLARSFI